MSRLATHTTFRPSAAGCLCELGAMFRTARDALWPTMQFAVRMMAFKCKIIGTVVSLVVVEMVNHLRTGEAAAKSLLHNVSVFQDVALHGIGMERHSQQDISGAGQVTTRATLYAEGVVTAPKAFVLASDAGGLLPTSTRARTGHLLALYRLLRMHSSRESQMMASCESQGLSLDVSPCDIRGLREGWGRPAAAFTQHGYSLTGFGV